MASQINWIKELFASAPTEQPRAVAAPSVAVKPVQRHYWRCPDCLSVSVTEGKLDSLPRDNWGHLLYCSLCSVRCEYMGVLNVRANVLQRFTDVCACNEICQAARGPSCSCKCGGKYHGQSISVRVVASVSGVPEIAPLDAKAKFRRDEYRAALDAAIERCAWAYAAMEAKRRGEYLPDSVYWPARQALDDLREAKRRAQHGPRLKALAKVGAGHNERGM